MWCGVTGKPFRRLRRLVGLFRRSPRVAQMGHSYEKAGLKVSGEPIPWNADSVVVEAVLECWGRSLENKSDLELHLPCEIPLTPAALEYRGDDCCQVLFRLPPSQVVRTG